MRELFSGSDLLDLIDKVASGQRLDFADGVRLFNSHDLLAIGYMADMIRVRKNSNVVYFGSNPLGLEENLDDNQPFFLSPDRVVATIIYGPNESAEQRVSSLLKLREWQELSGSCLSFAPLAVCSQASNAQSPENTSPATGFEDMKMLAVGRILLDNISHVTALWEMIGPKLAQVSLNFGVDDLAGPMVDASEVQARDYLRVTKQDMVKIIKAAKYIPLERDSLFNIVQEFTT